MDWKFSLDCAYYGGGTEWFPLHYGLTLSLRSLIMNKNFTSTTIPGLVNGHFRASIAVSCTARTDVGGVGNDTAAACPGGYCTQCEAEGFCRITPFQDPPTSWPGAPATQ